MAQILKFNTQSMTRDTILAVATGREGLLDEAAEVVKNNLSGESANQHILITAQRGMGKSFFLRLVEIEVENMRRNEGLPAAFALFPEEQHNVTHPSALIEEIVRTLEGRPAEQGMPKWADDDSASWNRALTALDAALDAEFGAGKGLIVAGIENFDELLKTAFSRKADEAQLRKLMTENRRVMLLATNLLHSADKTDKDYDRPLFHAFRRMTLKGWDDGDYANYLKRRFRYQKKPDYKHLVSRLRPKIKAVAAFAGGAPRTAVTLADFLMENDAISAAEAIEELIDGLAPYYQDLEQRIPPNSRALFDALIRGGEPATQSEIAARVGTTQNRIAAAFKWLTLQDYVVESTDRRKGRARYFQAADRLFAHYYRRRHLDDAHGPKSLHCMTEFLESFYSIPEHFAQARALFKRGEYTQEAAFFTDMAAKMVGLPVAALSDEERRELADILGGDARTLDDFKDDAEVKAELDKVLGFLADIPQGRKRLDPADMAETIRDDYWMDWIAKINLANSLVVTKERTRLWRKSEPEVGVHRMHCTGVGMADAGLRKFETWVAQNIGPSEHEIFWRDDQFPNYLEDYYFSNDGKRDVNGVLSELVNRAKAGRRFPYNSIDSGLFVWAGLSYGFAVQPESAPLWEDFLSISDEAGMFEVKLELLCNIALQKMEEKNFEDAWAAAARLWALAEGSEHEDLLSFLMVGKFLIFGRGDLSWRWVDISNNAPAAGSGFTTAFLDMALNAKGEFENTARQWTDDCKAHMKDKAALMAAAPAFVLAIAARQNEIVKSEAFYFLRLYILSFANKAPALAKVFSDTLDRGFFDVNCLEFAASGNPDEKLMIESLFDSVGYFEEQISEYFAGVERKRISAADDA